MTLLKKAMRDIWRGRRSYIACIVLIAFGIASYVSINMAYLNLSAAQNSLYAQQRFADVFAADRGLPVGQARRLGEIEGVAECAVRLRYQARVLWEDSDILSDIIISSYDPEQEAPINGFQLERGEAAREGIILGEDFAAANGLDLGDLIRLNFAGRARDIPVVGIATSAEYIYNIRSVSDMFPDPLRFGYAYMDYRDLSALIGQDGWGNSILFLLEPGAAFDEVRYTIQDMLAPYGLISLYERDDQPSHSMLEMEIDSLGSMASSMPMLFIGMSVILLYIMLKRIIGQERTQIGMLKAYGHSTMQIVLHYLCYGLAVGLCGGLVGDILAYLMTGGMTNLYLDYFSLPRLAFGINPFYMAFGIFIATAAGLLGAFFGAMGVLRMSPGEAMRPAAPPPVSFDWLSRIKGLQKLLATSGRMALRSIDRARFRSGFVVMGVMFAFSLMAVLASFSSMIDSMVFDQYTKVEVYDIRLNLNQPADYHAGLEAAWALPGVTGAEGLLEIPAEVSAQHRSSTAVLTGIQADSSLYHLYDTDRMMYVPLPPGGIVLSKAMAEELEVLPGEVITITSHYLPGEVKLTVLALVSQSVGSGCYLQLDTLWDILQTDPVVSALIFNSQKVGEIKSRLAQAGNVAALTHKTEALLQMRQLIGSVIYMIWSMQGIGVVIAFAIISTTSSIALAERKREYATLRVLGMQPQEVGQIMTFEYWLLTAVGAVLGIPLAMALKTALGTMVDPKLFTIPTYTPPYAYLVAAAGCAAAVFFASRSMVKQVTKFDLIEVLKERE